MKGTASMMTAMKRRLAWIEACRKLNLTQSSDDWPEHLGLAVIGGLYNPDDWGILGGALRAAADAGELEVNRKTRTAARQVQAGGPCRGYFSGGTPVDPGRMVRFKTVETTQEIITASAASVARYLEGSDIDFPPLLLAWLSPHLAQGAETEAFVEHPDSKASVNIPTKRKTKIEVFEELLVSVEGAWQQSKSEAICRSAWPGTSKDLYTLAGRLYPDVFGSMQQDSFYRNYSKNKKLVFSGVSGVREIYAELFPSNSKVEVLPAAA